MLLVCASSGIYLDSVSFMSAISLIMFKGATLGIATKMKSSNIKVENIFHLWYAYGKFHPDAYVFLLK